MIALPLIELTDNILSRYPHLNSLKENRLSLTVLLDKFSNQVNLCGELNLANFEADFIENPLIPSKVIIINFFSVKFFTCLACVGSNSKLL